MQPAIQVDQIRKRYRDCEALSGVSFYVPQGVVFALLGENGAGKTTLIKCLTGFERPDGGTAQVLGLDCRSQPLDIRRRIGYVSDQPALYDWMRVDEIGWFTSAFYEDGFLRRYHQLIERYEVPTRRKIRQLSKGQRAKVALALATAHDPDLLILDEPTSGLDPVVRRQFLESMVDRAAIGKTVFLSSHQINEVERVADWVAIMHQGALRVVQPLGDLKQTTRDIRVTLTDPMVEIPLPDSDVLTHTRSGRQTRLLALDVPDAYVTELREAAGVVAVDVQTPTLEDIFVACTHGTPADRGGRVEEVVGHEHSAQ